MKKFLPLILLVVGLGILTAAGFFVLKGRKTVKLETEEKATLIEVPLNERPIASLTPSADGYWLALKIEKIVIEAASLDYELLYKLPDGRTQGVPGTVQLDGQKVIERDLLLGSESSGKFRYDEGVERGTLTLRFRNKQGKLLAKFSTDFHLQSGVKKLSLVDEVFSYTLKKVPKGVFFVTMKVFGVPQDAPGEVSAGPYGVFSFAKSGLAGSVEAGETLVYRFTDGEWRQLEDGTSANIGIFIGTSQ